MPSESHPDHAQDPDVVRSVSAPAGYAGGSAAVAPEPWWRSAVFYQVYIRSFADSDGDGVGDLAGLRARLPYLRMLGIDAIWITPFFTSPMADHGYDVADPRDVDPLFGTLADFEAMVREAHEQGLRVTIDLVPNHTSDQHPWFRAALYAAPDSPERERYIFRDGRGVDGSEPPNNWPSIFGGPAWTKAPDGQWYLHIFAPEQPDLNWTNRDVVDDLERTMRFWLDRAVDGFRIDVAHGMSKPAGLPDFPRLKPNGDLPTGARDLRFDDDGVHAIHRRIRQVVDDYPERMAVGEVWVTNAERLSDYARPDELHLVFNFRLLEADWNADELRDAIEMSLRTVAPYHAPACWVLSNHDVSRAVARYGGGDAGWRRARAAALLQLALPGTAYIYQGDELGLSDVDVPDSALQDPIWERSGHTRRGRDAYRIPIPWEGSEPPYGFTEGDHTWLPMPAGWERTTVDAQLDDATSMLSLYRMALELRYEHKAFAGEELRWYAAPTGCLAFRRSGGLVCVVNVVAAPMPLPPGELLLSSGPLIGELIPADTVVWLYDPEVFDDPDAE